jgi:type II restriction enzyme
MEQTDPLLKTEILRKIHHSLSLPHKQVVNPESDLMSPKFLAKFATRLKMFHANHGPTKKAGKYDFEHIFSDALNYAGNRARLNTTSDPVDITIDCRKGRKRPFQLKTEMSRIIKKEIVYISKFREGRFIRQCTTKPKLWDYIEEVLLPHIDEFEAIFLLRGMSEGKYVRYDLLELPSTTLKRIQHVPDHHIKIHKKKNKSYTIPIKEGRKTLMNFFFCGGVEKISIKDMPVTTCDHHATWWIEVGGKSFA